MPQPAHVVLLRGVNVGGRNMVPMAALRGIAAECGFDDARTYLQSGNLLVHTAADADAVGVAIRSGLRAALAVDVPVVVVSRATWLGVSAACPYPEAAASRPNLLHAGFAATPVLATAAEQLARLAGADERVAAAADVLWIDYASGVGRSRLTPATLDRAVGAPVTCRNMRTIEAIAAMLAE